ncbi:lysozyme g-like [Nerophis lumbriciformis]|uniref:lysozyme g-like n=1 Tax=Nerophis lumbriciformis TaxID=546530 RepID=UPI002ADFA56B|nr:lysozyme g-like [Nerophis lumbriciformis]XP_061839926.1 lysozyme g-like [Nerophis lumbriciformis]
MSHSALVGAQTTGAGSDTSRQDNKGLRGVAASHNMAQTDLGRMNHYKSIITQVGNANGVDPAIIAGIISRESRAGNALDSNGCGDHGNAFGLMQVDKRYHTPKGEWNSKTHLSHATDILTGFIQDIRSKFPGGTASEQLKGGLAAYNQGPGAVHSLSAVDANTTGRDYSNDVIARAQWYSKYGGF